MGPLQDAQLPSAFWGTVTTTGAVSRTWSGKVTATASRSALADCDETPAASINANGTTKVVCIMEATYRSQEYRPPEANGRAHGATDAISIGGVNP